MKAQIGPVAEIGLGNFARKLAAALEVFVIVEEVVAALLPGARVNAAVLPRFWGGRNAEGLGERFEGWF